MTTNLEKWMFYLKDLESPDHYIKWNLFYIISSALARKVWLDDSEIFPNLYLLFIAPPAVGKSLPATKGLQMMESLQEVEDGAARKIINISPDSVTLESLFQQISKASRSIRTPDGKCYTHASMSFCLAEELAVLFRDKSNDLIQFLNAGYACGNFRRTTKHQGNDEIHNMCINLLGCATPDWIRDNISTGMIAQGFTSRAIFLYAERARHRISQIKFTSEQLMALAEVKAHVREVAKAFGKLSITPEADAWRDEWVAKKMDKQIINPDRRLEYYYARKKIHLYKMAIIRHFCERTDSKLTVEDFVAAEKDLLEIEPDMHKALASTGTNPINTVAEAIKVTLRLKGPQNNTKILIDHFHIGDEEQQMQAINYLITTGQITASSVNGKTVYHLVKTQEV